MKIQLLAGLLLISAVINNVNGDCGVNGTCQDDLTCECSDNYTGYSCESESIGLVNVPWYSS